VVSEFRNEQQEKFWQAYLNSLLPGLPHPPTPDDIWYFGDNPTLADELLELVLAGVKTATCGMLQEFEHLSETVPITDQISLVTHFNGEPGCVVQTVSVQVLPFNQVTADFAAAEGEGDRSYEYWWAAHNRYFSRRCQILGLPFSENMPVVCERFRVIYP
jgi:uncharacterized protein YhfF